MSWKKLLGYGALIWVLMFVIVSIFIGFKIYDSVWMEIVVAVIGGILSYIMAGYAKPASVGQALAYGFAWTAVGLILDLIITMRFNPAVFYSWTMWLGYALGFLAPLLQVRKPTAPMAGQM